MGMNHQPNPQHPFKSSSFLQSFGFAFQGLQCVFQSERNFRTHIFLTIFVTCAGFYWQVSRMEWAILLLCITGMLAVEALNTALEYLTDMLANGVYSEKAKVVKDIAAGACLMTAIGTATTGSLVFYPYVMQRLQPLLESAAFFH